MRDTIYVNGKPYTEPMILRQMRREGTNPIVALAADLADAVNRGELGIALEGIGNAYNRMAEAKTVRQLREYAEEGVAILTYLHSPITMKRSGGYLKNFVKGLIGTTLATVCTGC